MVFEEVFWGVLTKYFGFAVQFLNSFLLTSKDIGYGFDDSLNLHYSNQISYFSMECSDKACLVYFACLLKSLSLTTLFLFLEKKPIEQKIILLNGFL